MANGAAIDLGSLFSVGAIDDVVAVVAHEDQGEDVAVVLEHVLVGGIAGDDGLDEDEALLVDEGVVGEGDVGVSEVVAALDACPG